MDATQLLQDLIDLADEAGLRVRPLGRTEVDPTLPATSGVCRLRGEIWIVLAGSDSVEERIEVLSGALAEHAADFLEARWLPPALRARLSRFSL